MSTTTIPETQKALLLQEKDTDLVVSTIPVYTPSKDEVLVKVHSAALNPGDWKLKKWALFVKTFPNVLGFDISGEVVKVGEGVEGLKVGDRVFTQGVIDNNPYAGFQQYALADVHTLAKIPSRLSYDEASTLPVALSAAYAAFYNAKENGGFGFDSPAKGGRGKYKNTSILIIGGAGAVGQSAIQLAKVSGFNPILTTASLKNKAALEALGATHVLDRTQPLTVDYVQSILGKPLDVVFDTISEEETEFAGLGVLPSGGRLVGLSPELAEKVKEKADAEGKEASFTMGVKQFPQAVDILREMWREVGELIERGEIKPNEVEALEGGLAGVNAGLERLEAGKVSKIKLVVHPQETA